MANNNNSFLRTGSGMWKVVSEDEAKAAELAKQKTPQEGLPAAKKATGAFPAAKPTTGAYPVAKPPTGSFPAASPKTPATGAYTGSASSVARTPSRGLPQALNERAAYMVELARADLNANKLSSAENSLRLAMSFDPTNKECAQLLEEVAMLKEMERKAKAKP